MKPNLLTAFLDDSIRQVSAIRGILRRVSLHGGLTSEVGAARAHIESILISAAEADRVEFADLARKVDLKLERFQVEGADPTYLNEALELLSSLDTALLKASIDDDTFSLELNDLLLEPFQQDT